MHLKIVSLFAFLLAAASWPSVFSQDFDYDEDSAGHRSAPARLRPGYSGPVAPKPTPIAILKQINRHNEDGSYTYGYESADGSFKIETKLPTGEVKGKYGFVDDVGKLRVVEYGATKYGFEPQGEGITVAPPTLVDETTQRDGSQNPAYADAYYRPEPHQAAAPIAAPAPRLPRPRPQLQQAQPSPSFDSGYTTQLQFGPAPRRAQPAPQPSARYSPAPSADIEYSLGSRAEAVPQRPSFRPRPQSFSFEPAPIREEDDYSEPAAPAPAAVRYARPAPLPQYAPAAASRPGPVVTRQSGGGVGILDQLAKDYALPAGANALHDISFGYY